LAHGPDVAAMFETLVDRLGDLLPDFGKVLAMDGRAIPPSSRSEEAYSANGSLDPSVSCP